jgi:hypothetical protein
MATVTPQELGKLLDVTSRAQVTVAEGYALAPVLAKLIAFANQPNDISIVLPIPPKEQGQQLDLFPDNAT